MTTAITMTELAELILITLYEISTAGETYRPQDIKIFLFQLSEKRSKGIRG